MHSKINTAFKAYLKHSRNVFVIMLTTYFIIAPVYVLIEFLLDMFRRAGDFQTFLSLTPLVVMDLNKIVGFWIIYLGVSEFFFINFIPVGWLICCLVARGIVFNLPRRLFWFFISASLFTDPLYSLVRRGVYALQDGGLYNLTLFSGSKIFSYFLFAVIGFSFWWTVDRLRGKHVRGDE